MNGPSETITTLVSICRSTAIAALGLGAAALFALVCTPTDQQSAFAAICIAVALPVNCGFTVSMTNRTDDELHDRDLRLRGALTIWLFLGLLPTAVAVGFLLGAITGIAALAYVVGIGIAMLMLRLGRGRTRQDPKQQNTNERP